MFICINRNKEGVKSTNTAQTRDQSKGRVQVVFQATVVPGSCMQFDSNQSSLAVEYLCASYRRTFMNLHTFMSIYTYKNPELSCYSGSLVALVASLTTPVRQSTALSETEAIFLSRILSIGVPFFPLMTVRSSLSFSLRSWTRIAQVLVTMSLGHCFSCWRVSAMSCEY